MCESEKYRNMYLSVRSVRVIVNTTRFLFPKALAEGVELLRIALPDEFTKQFIADGVSTSFASCWDDGWPSFWCVPTGSCLFFPFQLRFSGREKPRVEEKREDSQLVSNKRNKASSLTYPNRTIVTTNHNSFT